MAKQQPERRFTLLYDKVCRQDILQEAWQRVKSNKGAAGVDEVDIDEIREYGEARFLGEIAQELRDGSYRVSLVRRVHIPKPGQPEKTRPLGIPTVKDRVVQMAVKLGIEPLFEADFMPCSYGFRPEKTPRMALSIIAEKTQAGYSHVVDVDLKSYFDTLSHELLLELVGRRVGDVQVVRLSLSRGIAKRKKKPRTEAEVNQAIGRLRERYCRVGRYYQIRYEAERRALIWEADAELKRRAERLDGSYVLKSDRRDQTKEEIWRQYILLTRVESAFRAMKSPLMERPIFHHLVRRVETHIFLCVLAYHLLATVEKTFLDQGIHTSWASLREQLATHQVVTVVLPTSDGQQIRIRKATTPEPEHRRIYQVLRIPDNLLDPARSRPIVTERTCK